jgi:aquaporin Z
MEVDGGHANKGSVLLYELIGTALLILSVNASVKFGDFLPVCVGAMLFANIAFMGGVSGGHYNPAVSLGVFVSEGLTY